MGAPILGIFGGDDQGITPDTVATFRDALAAAGVEHEVISMAGAPHSFFDRKQETFATAPAEAWAAVQAFIRKHTAAA
jgi:carboxymethylenebutenolidase